MNSLKGTITAVETEEGISLVTVDAGGILLSALVIDTPETAAYLVTGTPVFAVFKETEISIGKNLSGGLSLRNRIPAVITAITGGKILSSITLDVNGHTLCSVITTRSAVALGLSVGERVEGLVKTTEVSLMQTAA
ncbi:TOBE domain-containing protein [Compostibacter hankyongensis]|uniref:TOBE domain-containing protein n=1 Tax=Compostibacter hankyongensis TaxID=1007089 RepID=UPI0031EC7E95